MSGSAERGYFGTKRITAWPEEKDGKQGYGVRYQPDGYVSWSPADVFEAAYQPLDALSFGHALVALKSGETVGRDAWVDAGEACWLTLVKVDGGAHPFLVIVAGNSGGVGPWMPSLADIFANDWHVVGQGVGDASA